MSAKKPSSAKQAKTFFCSIGFPWTSGIKYSTISASPSFDDLIPVGRSHMFLAVHCGKELRQLTLFSEGSMYEKKADRMTPETLFVASTYLLPSGSVLLVSVLKPGALISSILDLPGSETVMTSLEPGQASLICPLYS